MHALVQRLKLLTHRHQPTAHGLAADVRTELLEHGFLAVQR